ncbi:MAG TPA: tRNA (pseudouridine(54)-N(1))-methyltransferase TrmY [Thermoplasmata archaeon]|nr:tRNA (pseudouridine(54)-N(1))-methyltransferase TrmY [Thermoplasmata archaeon]
MRRFLVVGHRAVTTPDFTLDDLAGGAGRMDILLSAANAALLLAHDIRRDAEADLLLLGPPDPPRLVRILGHRVRTYQPDLRSNAALVRKALEHGSRVEREVWPGILASKTSFPESLDRLGPTFVYLKEGGKDIRGTPVPADATFVLSDNQDLTPDEERAVLARDALVIGLGPLAVHTDQAIVLVQNELDRRGV